MMNLGTGSKNGKKGSARNLEITTYCKLVAKKRKKGLC
jgi:hypothetical protein